MAGFHSYSSPLAVVQSFLEPSVPLLYTVILSAEEESALTVFTTLQIHCLFVDFQC